MFVDCVPALCTFNSARGMAQCTRHDKVHVSYTMRRRASQPSGLDLWSVDWFVSHCAFFCGGVLYVFDLKVFVRGGFHNMKFN